MTSYVLLSFLQLLSVSLSFGEYLEESNVVYKHGLPELTRDILEKIKLATGQPINTNLFFPIIASPSKDHEIIKHQPHQQYSKYLTSRQNEALEGGHYHANKGDNRRRHEKDRFYELGEKGFDARESDEHEYGDQTRHRHQFHEGRFFKKNHHASNGGKKKGEYKNGRRHGKFHVEKGFRDIYHKDEEKKSDFFWNNQHEEGKWIEYGFKNKKSEKSHDKGGEGKKERGKTEESSYEKKENKCTKCKTR